MLINDLSLKKTTRDESFEAPTKMEVIFFPLARKMSRSLSLTFDSISKKPTEPLKIPFNKHAHFFCG
jgi:hypothetical protein